MSISRDDVAHVARLANLTLDDAEIDRMVRDLGKILEFAERLEALDADGIDVADTGGEAGTPLREDSVETWLAPGRATSSAPDPGENLFRVPPVLEGETP